MTEVLEVIERVRDGEEAKKVVHGLYTWEGKDREDASGGLRERTGRFLNKVRKRK